MPVFNRLNFTRRCLRNIRQQTYKNIETIVIDDGSKDDTFKYVRRHYPEVHVIRGNGNWWWSRSIYEGVEYALARARRRDFVLLMNNDCFFEPGYVKQLLSTADKYPLSIIGSFCITTSRPVRVVEAGVRIHWPTGLVYSVAEAISTDPAYYRNMEIIDNLDVLPGKGTLIPISVIKKIGNINYERLPHYIADYEFFSRAKRSGFPLIVDVKAIIKHVWEATGYRSKSTESILGIREAWTLLFGRKSMNNIVDWLNFLILACPKEYLFVNMRLSFFRLINGVMRVFPLVYVLPIIKFVPQSLRYELRLWFYRLILKIKQFPKYHLSKNK